MVTLFGLVALEAVRSFSKVVSVASVTLPVTLSAVFDYLKDKIKIG